MPATCWRRSPQLWENCAEGLPGFDLWPLARRRNGFCSGRNRLEFPVGDGFRQLLPQYPGTAPVATVYASVSLGGSVNLRLEMLAYDGRLVMEDEPISLTLAGVSAELVFSGDDVSVDFDVGTVKLSDGATGFLVDGMALGLETSDSVSELGLSFDLGELSVSDADSKTQLDAQSIAGSGRSKVFYRASGWEK